MGADKAHKSRRPDNDPHVIHANPCFDHLQGSKLDKDLLVAAEEQSAGEADPSTRTELADLAATEAQMLS